MVQCILVSGEFKNMSKFSFLLNFVFNLYYVVVSERNKLYSMIIINKVIFMVKYDLS